MIFLIQQVKIQEYILENLFLKLKCQKLDKHELTGKDCCGKGVCVKTYLLLRGECEVFWWSVLVEYVSNGNV